MSQIKIGGIERFSLVDYPEKIVATIFMQGCPWRCPFCHNGSLQSAQSETYISWEKLLSFFEQRKGKLDAIVFSGGEPLMQDELLQAMQDVKDLGYNVGLHTGGYRPQMFKKILPLVDWVGFDIKAPFEEEHYRQATGGINHLAHVLESLDMLIASGIHFECRTTCYPKVLDLPDIYKIGESLKAKGVKEYYLQKYRPIPSDTTTHEIDCDKFFKDEELLNWLRTNFAKFDIRT